MIHWILATSLVFFATLVQAASFEGKTRFQSYSSEGRFTVTCFGPKTQHHTHYCRENGLTPSPWSYFTHNTNAKANRLVLTSKGSDGRKVTKKSKWDAKKKRSKKEINLWVKTLLQTPLLVLGHNDIQFQLKNGNKVVEDANFDVYVSKGEHKVCEDISKSTSDKTLCENVGYACQHYFSVAQKCK